MSPPIIKFLKFTIFTTILSQKLCKVNTNVEISTKDDILQKYPKFYKKLQNFTKCYEK